MAHLRRAAGARVLLSGVLSGSSGTTSPWLAAVGGDQRLVGGVPNENRAGLGKRKLPIGVSIFFDSPHAH